MFHLFTHAFFKALLFLGAGSVIHAMHHEQDMRHYGGLRRHIPYTFWAMLIGTLAITGVGIPLTTIGFAGFLSKDAIVESAWASGSSFAFWSLVLAAAMTAFYSWRLMFLTFFGAPRWGLAAAGHHSPGEVGTEEAPHGHGHEAAHTPHESPLVMLIPLGVLALGAAVSGMIWFNSFFGEHERMASFFAMPHHEEEGGSARLGAGEAEPIAATGDTPEEAAAADGAGDATALAAASGEVKAAASAAEGHHDGVPGAIYMSATSEEVLDAAHHSPVWVKLSPFLAMLLGLGLAYLMYMRRPDLPGRLAATNRPLYEFLLNKWYFDEIYDAVFVRPAGAIGRLFWRRGDGTIIDGGINGLALGIVPTFTRLAGRAQSGYVFHYAFAMVIGLALILTWFSLTGGVE